MGDHFSAAGDPPSPSERRRQREIEEYRNSIPIVEERDGKIYVGNNPNALDRSWLIACLDVSRLCKLSRRTMQYDDCVACKVSKIAKRDDFKFPDEEDVIDRLEKAEELLNRTIRGGELSPSEWVKLVLEVVGFLNPDLGNDNVENEPVI